ncbi:MAG: hypothetical protein HOV79_26655 [Hamadaea sp.]|nr:hypothetical protein [Hamadaea sp.]
MKGTKRRGIRRGWRNDQKKLTLTDELQAALSAATEAHLHAAAEEWARTEESWRDADGDAVQNIVSQLAVLARHATAGGQRLYCWVCV